MLDCSVFLRFPPSRCTFIHLTTICCFHLTSTCTFTPFSGCSKLSTSNFFRFVGAITNELLFHYFLFLQREFPSLGHFNYLPFLELLTSWYSSVFLLSPLHSIILPFPYSFPLNYQFHSGVASSVLK